MQEREQIQSDESSSSSEYEKVERASQFRFTYAKQDWIKVTFNNIVKRIYNPPKNLPELILILRRRYSDLEKELSDFQTDIALYYLDNDGDEIEVEDTRDLLEAYRFAQLVNKQNILKFFVNVYQKSPQLKNEDNLSQKFEKQVELAEEHQVQKEVQMIDAHDEKDELNVANISSEDSIDIQQQNQYLEIARNREEQKVEKMNKSLIKEYKMEPAYDVSKLEEKSISVSEAVVKLRKYDVRVELLIAVECLPCTDKQYINKQKANEVKQSSSIWQKLTSLVKGNQIPEQKKDGARLLSSQDVYARGLPPCGVVLKWVVQNRSQHKWDQGVIIRNICTDDAIVPPILIKNQLKTNDIIELIVTAYLPKDLQKDKIVLLFQLETAKHEKFGDSLIGIIDIGPSEEQEQQMFEKSLYMQPNMNNISIKQSEINQSVFLDEQTLYLQSSKLADEGYGTFDRCYSVLKACKGDEKEAQKVLSKLIFKQHKKMDE